MPTVRGGEPQFERRLRFLYRNGELRHADRAIASQAGIATEGRVVFQFYPDALYRQLLRLEREALGSRSLASVRRTIFGVRYVEPGYEFYVQKVE